MGHSPAGPQRRLITELLRAFQQPFLQLCSCFISSRGCGRLDPPPSDLSRPFPASVFAHRLTVWLQTFRRRATSLWFRPSRSRPSPFSRRCSKASKSRSHATSIAHVFKTISNNSPLLYIMRDSVVRMMQPKARLSLLMGLRSMREALPVMGRARLPATYSQNRTLRLFSACGRRGSPYRAWRPIDANSVRWGINRMTPTTKKKSKSIWELRTRTNTPQFLDGNFPTWPQPPRGRSRS